MESLAELISIFPEIKAGRIGAVGTAIMLGVRIYRAFGGPWPDQKHRWIARLSIAAVSLLVSLLIGVFVGGAAWPVAIMEAFAVFGTALAANAATKTAGAMIKEEVPFQASPFRDAS